MESLTAQWRNRLHAARRSPLSLTTYMVGTANMQLDPMSPLASLVPVGLLEGQAVEVRRGTHLERADNGLSWGG